MYSRFQYVNNMKTIFYFTAIISLFFVLACSNKSSEKNINEEASLPNPLLDKVADLKVINSSINTKKHTTSLLYGNQKAIERIQSNSSVIQKGEKLVWITWNQKPDPNWFGAVIPGKLISFETLESVSENGIPQYQKFGGNSIQIQNDTLGNHHRIEILLHQKMAILP
jgi:hypothetical protein